MSTDLTADDRDEIRDLLHRYAWAIDTGDADAFEALFWPHAVLVWDAFERPEEWRGLVEIRAFAEDLRDLPATAGRQHYVANVIFGPCGSERVSVKAYVVVFIRQDDSPQISVTGWYDDEFVRIDGAWKIARHVIRDWTGPILHRIAGQDGKRVGRPRPPILEGLGRRPK